MALAVASTTTAFANDSDSLVINKPTGVALGDLLIIVASGFDNSDFPAVSGFTNQIDSGINNPGAINDSGVSLLYRVADASDVSATNYTITLAGANTSGAAAMYRITGWTTGNPVYSSASFGSYADAASYTMSSGAVTLSRPTSQLILIAGYIRADGNITGDISNYTITSSDSNPTWTELYDVDITTNVASVNGTFFTAYASSSDTSDITGVSIDAASSSVGDEDGYAVLCAVIAEPASAAGTTSLLSVTPTTFSESAVGVGTTGTHTLLSSTPSFASASGSAKQTVWSNDVRPTLTQTLQNAVTMSGENRVYMSGDNKLYRDGSTRQWINDTRP